MLVLAIAVVAGCAAPRGGAPWSAALGRDHQLVGRLWDVRAARFMGEGTLACRLAASRFVLLGEKHDNPDHHRLQARLARAVYEAGRRPALALEMITPAQHAALIGYVQAHPRDAAGLGPAIGWGRSGWPPWPQYAPIVQAALDAGTAIVPANLDTAAVRAVARGAAAEAGLVARFQLDRPLSAAEAQALAEEIREAHCRALPESAVPGMVRAQRARDATMAAAMLDADGDGAILVAGAGHVRTDRGVPALLTAAAPAARVTSVAFVEVADTWTAPSAYAARFGAAAVPFDVVWFTPRANDDDPCAGMRPPAQ